MSTKKIYLNKEGKEVLKPHSIVYNGCTYVPPTDEILIAAGYEIRQVEIYEPVLHVPTYEEKVVQFIREKYTVDDELAILRQRDVKTEEFIEYNNFCEECKLKAKINF